MKVSGCLGLVAASLAVCLSGPAEANPDARITLRITALTGSVVRLGSESGFRLYGVRLRVTLCLPSRAAARSTYPSEIRITHYAVTKTPRRWWAARTTIDHAPWLVPFGETWAGRCGPVAVEDAIPPDHYGVESLGNPNGCYGVAVTIKAAGAAASRRMVVTCGRRFG